MIPVTLSPEGSAFFIFKKSSKKPHVINLEKDGTILTEGNDPLVNGASRIFVKGNQVEILDKGNYQLNWDNGKKTMISNLKTAYEYTIDGPWEINFMEKPSLGKPATIKIDSLKSWTEFAQQSIKYFSGTARYKKAFILNDSFIKTGRVYLDLGNVQELATIIMNGYKVRTCWIAPYRADVTECLKKGNNLLEIDITNLWPNRLIGDGKLAKEDRKTRSNLTEDQKFRFYSTEADKYLRVSGLLGPVKLQISHIYKLK